MSGFEFADRYAEAGIAPGAAIITAREAPAKRIEEGLTTEQLFDLVGVYFNHPGLNLTWFRDEFIKEDASFSLVNNERECRILAAAILGAVVAVGDSTAILALLAASTADKRAPVEATWLLDETKAAILQFGVSDRNPSAFETTIKLSAIVKLAEEISAIPQNDWPILTATLAKVRTESQEAAKALATQVSAALGPLKGQLSFMREETQMLWWLFGEHSRTLKRHFGGFPPGQIAIIAGVELGDLTTASSLGPVAAPAMLERMLRLARKDKVQKKSLAAAIDGIARADLRILKTYGTGHPPRIFPIMTAIEKAKENGPGSWHGAFESAVGFEAKTEFEPIELATQVYYEHLLGQLV